MKEIMHVSRVRYLGCSFESCYGVDIIYDPELAKERIEQANKRVTQEREMINQKNVKRKIVVAISATLFYIFAYIMARANELEGMAAFVSAFDQWIGVWIPLLLLLRFGKLKKFIHESYNKKPCDYFSSNEVFFKGKGKCEKLVKATLKLVKHNDCYMYHIEIDVADSLGIVQTFGFSLSDLEEFNKVGSNRIELDLINGRILFPYEE